MLALSSCVLLQSRISSSLSTCNYCVKTLQRKQKNNNLEGAGLHARVWGKQDNVQAKESQGYQGRRYEQQVLGMFAIKSVFKSELWTCQHKKRK